MSSFAPSPLTTGTHDDIATTAHWFGAPARPLLGWRTTPAAGPSSSGVLVLPDVGAQYWSAHRTLRVLAERLGGRGHTVLRMDYDGTGDSAGSQWDPGRVAAWRASAAAGAAELRALGCEELTVVGVRFGALLALLDGAQLGADRVVAWDPPASGKRLARSLRLLGEPVPDDDGIVSAGVVFTAETLADLARLDPGRAPAAPAPRVLVLGELAPGALTHLRELGSDVATEAPAGTEVALERSAEDAEAAVGVVDAVERWLVVAPRPVAAQPPGEAAAVLEHDGHRLRERVVRVAGLAGVLTEPLDPRTGGATLVLLNPGSGTHVGPGRSWVEIARAAAAAGHRALRVDWTGWGESPDEGHAPGRPYDRHIEAETIALVRALRAEGHERVVLSGLCASAWMALHVARQAGAAGVVAFNPQLYWRWGDPVLSQEETGLERTAKRLREERGRRLRLWSALDLVGLRSSTGRWLEGLHRAGVQVLVVFAEADDGLGYLHNRLGRHLRRMLRREAVRVEELPGVDHGLMRAWLRPTATQAVLAHLDRVA